MWLICDLQWHSKGNIFKILLLHWNGLGTALEPPWCRFQAASKMFRLPSKRVVMLLAKWGLPIHFKDHQPKIEISNKFWVGSMQYNLRPTMADEVHLHALFASQYCDS
jgi:hypothetical protein